MRRVNKRTHHRKVRYLISRLICTHKRQPTSGFPCNTGPGYTIGLFCSVSVCRVERKCLIYVEPRAYVDLRMQCLRDLSQKHKNNGNRPAIPPSVILFPIAHFATKSLLKSQISMVSPPLTKSLLSPLSHHHHHFHGWAYPRPQLRLRRVLKSWNWREICRWIRGGVNFVGWFIWDAIKGYIPCLFSIVRIVCRLVEEIIP